MAIKIQNTTKNVIVWSNNHPVHTKQNCLLQTLVPNFNTAQIQSARNIQGLFKNKLHPSEAGLEQQMLELVEVGVEDQIEHLHEGPECH